MKTQLVDFLGLGVGIWLIGYLASIALYSSVPSNILGWLLSVIFTPVALFICYLRFRKRREDIRYYLGVAVAWTLIAVMLDYIFIVTLFNSQTYYTPDVFVYYAVTFLIPLVVGFRYHAR